MSDLSAAFTAIIEATTDDPTGHLPNCGYTFENETCGCAAWGKALHEALAHIVADAEQRGREDNADHGMCYVHGSEALAAHDRALRERIAQKIETVAASGVHAYEEPVFVDAARIARGLPW